VNRYRQNGLGTIDAYFNAYFLYYQWKSDKKGRILKEELKTIATHPTCWGGSSDNITSSADGIYQKNKYDKYLAFLAFAAKAHGAVSALFSPLRRIRKFFGGFGNSARAAKNIGYLLGKTLGLAAPAFAVIFTMMTITNISAYSPVLELSFDGRSLGFVESRETVGRAVMRVENNVSAVLDEDYEFPGRLEYRIVLSREPEHLFMSESQLYNILYYSSQTQGAVTRAYGLYIDGMLIAATEYENDIRSVLDDVLWENTVAEHGETVQFAHEIQTIPNLYAAWDIVTREELKNIITFSLHNAEDDTNNLLFEHIFDGGNGNGEYPPEEYNNGYENGNGNGNGNGSGYITIEEAANAGATIFVEGGELFDPFAPSMGGNDEAAMATVSLLNLTSEQAAGTVPRGFLSVAANQGDAGGILARMNRTTANVTPNLIQFKKIRTETYTAETPFEIRYVDSSSHFTGTTVIQTAGRTGESIITADITFIGDAEVARDIIKNEVIKEPVTQVVLRGTRIRPSTAPTGNFIRPLRGRLTTRFAGGHRGIDIPAPAGTPVAAADGGTVIYAGFSGSYGNHVRVRHSNGYVTLYAHFSSISVSRGDSVFQGQELGKVGSTGRSTGNHLHFEIIRNGVQVNPELYLP
jgi:murein DD-endopeptidase MepM/ murein hydrolase activator NlpD